MIKNCEKYKVPQLLGSAWTGSALLQLSRHHILDTVCLAAMQLNWATPVCSHSVSADGIVQMALYNFHCIWSRRGWKSLPQQTPSGFVLYDPYQQQRPLVLSPATLILPPSYTHLLGGKAWISPFPLSLTLKCSLSPSHLVPLLSFPLSHQIIMCFYLNSCHQPFPL